MPYGPKEKPSGTDGLPAKARAIFKAAANSAYGKYGTEDEGRVHKIAWAAVKNAGYRKNKNGRWVAGDGMSMRDAVRKAMRKKLKDWNPDQPREPAGGPGGGQWTSGGGGGGEGGGGRSDRVSRLKAAAGESKGKSWESAGGKVTSLGGHAGEYIYNVNRTGDKERPAFSVSVFRNGKQLWNGAYSSEKTAHLAGQSFILTNAAKARLGEPSAREKTKIANAVAKPPSKRTPEEKALVSKAVKSTKATSEIDLSKVRRVFTRNENANRHSENVALLAKHFGTAEEQAKAAEIIKERDKIGSLPDKTDSVPNVREFQYEINKKYWGKLAKGARDSFISDRTRKVTRRDRFGREEGTWEEEDDDKFSRDALVRDQLATLVGDAVMVSDYGVDRKPGDSMMYDSIEMNDANVEFTNDGYMKAMPRIARSGIQVYRGSEVGKPEMDTVRIYRPVDEVFKNDAWKTYTHLPITVDHPSEPVTPNNWKQFAVGETGEEVLRDGDAARVPMMLRDAAAIKEYKNGKQQLSVGYDCDLSWTPGVTDSGEKYDAVQRNIRANHLAVVAAARGGPTLKIGDDSSSATKEMTMNLRTIIVDGVECQMADTAAVMVQRTIQGLQDQVENLRRKSKQAEEDEEEWAEDSRAKDAVISKHNEVVSAKDAEIAKRDEALKAKDAEITTLKQQVTDAQAELSPEKLDARVVDRLGVISKAKAFLGDKWTAGGKNTLEIRKEVVSAKVGDKAKAWTDAQIEAAFDSLQVPTFSQGRDNQARQPIDDAVAAFGKPGGGYTNVADEKAKAYAEYDQRMADAWKTPISQQH